MNSLKTTIVAVFVVILSLLVPGTVNAAVYTWRSNASSNAWNGSNWDIAGFPNAATSQAVINTASQNPVQITNGTSITLGSSVVGDTALTIGNSAGSTALNIASGGTLAITGATSTNLNGISNNKTITIGGTLSNSLSGATTRHYSISGTGGISLQGGTITATGTRGIFDLNQPVSGYGTLNGRISNFSTITANNATPITITGANFLNEGGTLAATGSGTFANSGTIGGHGTISAPITNNGTISATDGIMTI